MGEEHNIRENEDSFHRGDRVSGKGEKYYCPECKAEVPIKQACHTCGKEIDWARLMAEVQGRR